VNWCGVLWVKIDNGICIMHGYIGLGSRDAAVRCMDESVVQVKEKRFW